MGTRCPTRPFLSKTSEIDGDEISREAGSEGDQEMRPASAALDRAIEREERRGRGHIAEIAQDTGREGKIVRGKPEHLLPRLQDLGAPRKEQKARDLSE